MLIRIESFMVTDITVTMVHVFKQNNDSIRMPKLPNAFSVCHGTCCNLLIEIYDFFSCPFISWSLSFKQWIEGYRKLLLGKSKHGFIVMQMCS